MGRWISTQRVRRAVAWQRRAAGRFDPSGFPRDVRFVGGADIAFCPPDAQCVSGRCGGMGCMAVGVAAVWELQSQKICEVRCAFRRIKFPYIPGLLSFREAPLLLPAMRLIRNKVDVWMFDGQGISHPRGCGLATHMGIVANICSVGVAKSLLCGVCDQPPTAVGDAAPVVFEGRIVSQALRTVATAPPVYVSQGNRCTLPQALALAQACAGGSRLPEPTHIADLLSKELRLMAPAAARARIRLLVNGGGQAAVAGASKSGIMLRAERSVTQRRGVAANNN